MYWDPRYDQQDQFHSEADDIHVMHAEYGMYTFDIMLDTHNELWYYYIEHPNKNITRSGDYKKPYEMFNELKYCCHMTYDEIDDLEFELDAIIEKEDLKCWT